MHIDLSTKFILSLIAIALWGILITSFLTSEKVLATSKVVDVNLVEVNNRPVLNGIDVNIKRINNYPLTDRLLPIKVIQ